jgi:uncharacterized protein YqeY
MPAIDQIKARMTQAMRERDEITKNILGLALGEMQTAEARANRPLRDDEAAAIVRRLVKANEETLSLTVSLPPDAAQVSTLRREIEVLTALLPAGLSIDAIVETLAPLADAVRAAKSDGQAMGVAMKHLKAAGATVQTGDVQEAIKRVRASQ